jgi:hypothetical protein
MSKKLYTPLLIMLMSYLDEEKYEKSHEFTVEQMSAPTPADILRWMNVRAFGVPDLQRMQNLEAQDPTLSSIGKRHCHSSCLTN